MSYRVKMILPIAGMLVLMSIVVVMVVTGADREVKRRSLPHWIIWRL